MGFWAKSGVGLMNWIPLRLLWLLEHLGPNKSLCQIWIMMVIPRCSQGLKNHLSCGERYSNTPAFASSLSLSFSNWTGMNIMLFSYHGSTFKITLSSWIVMNNYWPWPGCGKWASFQLFFEHLKCFDLFIFGLIWTIVSQVAADEPAPTGNYRFEGFCVDLLEHIAQQVQAQTHH